MRSVLRTLSSHIKAYAAQHLLHDWLEPGNKKTVDRRGRTFVGRRGAGLNPRILPSRVLI